MQTMQMKLLLSITVISMTGSRAWAGCEQSAFNLHETSTTPRMVLQCDSSEDPANKLCVVTGYHQTLGTVGLSVEKLDGFEYVASYTHRPRTLRCRVSNPFGGCLHETVNVSRSKLKGYSYRAPDVVFNGTVESSFELDLVNGTAKFDYKKLGPGTSPAEESHLTMAGCRIVTIPAPTRDGIVENPISDQSVR